MSNPDQTAPDPENNKLNIPGAEPLPTQAPFEKWLDRKLKSEYGSVLQEPIPDDLINLLKLRLDQKPGQ